MKEAPELMAMGEYTLRVPHQRPTSLPQGCTVRQVMAFGTANRQKVYWFLAKSEDEIKYEYNFFFHVYFFPRLYDVSVHKLPTRPTDVSSSIRMKNDAIFSSSSSSSFLAPTVEVPEVFRCFPSTPVHINHSTFIYLKVVAIDLFLIDFSFSFSFHSIF